MRTGCAKKKKVTDTGTPADLFTVCIRGAFSQPLFTVLCVSYLCISYALVGAVGSRSPLFDVIIF